MREEKSNEKYDCYWCNQENNFCVEIRDNIVMIDDGTGTLKQAVFIGYKQIQINLNCSHCQNLNRIKLNL